MKNILSALADLRKKIFLRKTSPHEDTYWTPYMKIGVLLYFGVWRSITLSHLSIAPPNTCFTFPPRPAIRSWSAERRPRGHIHLRSAAAGNAVRSIQKFSEQTNAEEKQVKPKSQEDFGQTRCLIEMKDVGNPIFKENKTSRWNLKGFVLF